MLRMSQRHGLKYSDHVGSTSEREIERERERERFFQCRDESSILLVSGKFTEWKSPTTWSGVGDQQLHRATSRGEGEPLSKAGRSTITEGEGLLCKVQRCCLESLNLT